MKMQTIKRSNGFTIFLFLIGIFFIGFGISRGEVPIMFEKAINICLECIGIG